jgi:hypothetical protein
MAAGPERAGLGVAVGGGTVWIWRRRLAATAAICGGATADIIALDKFGPPEVVTITGSGNLTGWYIISLTGNQRFDFPNGFVAGGVVQIKSGVAEFANTSSMLWWTAGNIWNNASNDDAALFNCLGQQVDFFDDGV